MICGVKKKKYYLNIMSVRYSHIANFNIPYLPLHFQTSQLFEDRKMAKKIKSIPFAQLPSTMLPVQCCSEKINICWKVQIDDQVPSYCISCKVRHGQA